MFALEKVDEFNLPTRLTNVNLKIIQINFVFRSYHILLRRLEEQLADSGHEQWLSHLLGSKVPASFVVGRTPQWSVI
jgi:hypothetical protein